MTHREEKCCSFISSLGCWYPNWTEGHWVSFTYRATPGFRESSWWPLSLGLVSLPLFWEEDPFSTSEYKLLFEHRRPHSTPLGAETLTSCHSLLWLQSNPHHPAHCHSFLPRTRLFQFFKFPHSFPPGRHFLLILLVDLWVFHFVMNAVSPGCNCCVSVA